MDADFVTVKCNLNYYIQNVESRKKLYFERLNL